MKEVYRLQAQKAKAIANPIRIEIISLLRDKEMSVNELAEKTGLCQANVSQHLTVLKYNGVVVARRDANRIFYRLRHPQILIAFDTIQKILRDEMMANAKSAEKMGKGRKPKK